MLSIFSYNYFTQTTDKIQSLAVRELETNSEIEAFSISNGLGNAIYAITSNLELISSSPSTMDWNISGIQSLLEKGLESTANLTDGYYLLDKYGKLVTFTGIDSKDNAKYLGTDLGSREYFKVPEQNGSNYISTVIVSNDKVPRMYISVPIFSTPKALGGNTSTNTNVNESSNTPRAFEGVIFASIETKMLGRYLEGQIHPNFPGDITFVDRNGTILYTRNQTLVGEKIFGQEFQETINLILRDKAEEFNSIIRNAMISNSGLNQFIFGNNITTIAYNSVAMAGNNGIHSPNRIGTLFITAPHTLAEDVVAHINLQSNLTFIIIATIVAISFVTSILLLKWNRVLSSLVSQKTRELKETVSELSQSNTALTETKNALTSANERLALTNSRLKEANKALEKHDVQQKEFINIAAHELRTPSQAIAGNLELIEIAHLPSLLEGTSIGYDKLDKEFENLIKDKHHLHGFIEGLLSTYRNSQRLEKIVNDILDISRIEGKRLELHREVVNINEKIKNVIKDVHEKANENNKRSIKPIDVRFETEQDPILVLLDRTRMFQAISNLLNNAIKFSDNGTIYISVKKNTLRHNHNHNTNNSYNVTTIDLGNKNYTRSVIVSIKDNGKGIDNEILSKIFNKFVTKSDKGTGLGLYLAKSIIKAHGGEIWAENNKGETGATFSFRLPLPNE